MKGWPENCSLRFRHFRHPWRSADDARCDSDRGTLRKAGLHKNNQYQAIIPPCCACRCLILRAARPVLEDFMPIYGYQCPACGHAFELMQKMSDPAPSNCPACGQPDIRKQLSAAGFQLKGSGWYATDFKGVAKPTPDAKAAPEATASSEAKASPDKGGSASGPKTGNSAS